MKLNVLIAGQAGQGLDKTSDILCNAIVAHGLYVFNYREYQSQITGGTSFNVICIADKPVNSFDLSFDVAIFFDENKIKEFVNHLKQKAIVVFPTKFDETEFNELKKAKKEKKLKSFGIDIDAEIKKRGWNKIVKNTILLGIFSGIVGLDGKIFHLVIEKEIKKYLKDNIEAFDFGYRTGSEIRKSSDVEIELKKTNNNILYFKGNEAVAHMLTKSGIEFYLAYPMTPSTGLLNEMAKKVFTWQPESEIAVINAALGIAAAGKKVAIGSSGGGFALMVEGLSFAGMAELPIVIYLASRHGPSTGAPTYTSQADLKFAVNAGHGNFAKIVFALSTIKNAMLTVANAVYVAYKYRMPVILLSDKHFAESGFSIEESELKKIERYAIKISKEINIKKSEDKRENKSEIVKTYPLDNPFSPLPTMGEEIFKLNSYEHDEYGFFVQDAKSLTNMGKRRKKRIEGREKIINTLKCYEVYGNKNAKNLIIGWGSTVNTLVDFVTENKNYMLVEIISIDPIGLKKEIQRMIKKAKKIYIFECALKANILDLLKENFDLDERKVVEILKFDGRPFLLDEIKERLK